MTDKKEAVLLKINQINVELDSLFNQRLYAGSAPPPLICGAGIHFPQCDKVFTNKFLLVKETIHVLCLEALSDGARKINWVRSPTRLLH